MKNQVLTKQQLHYSSAGKISILSKLKSQLIQTFTMKLVQKALTDSIHDSHHMAERLMLQPLSIPETNELHELHTIAPDC